MATGPQMDLGTLTVRLAGDSAGATKALQQVQGEVKKTEKFVDGMSWGMERFALQAIGAIGPLTGAIGLLGSAMKGVQLAAQTEQMEIAFGTMLGAAEKGKAMVKDIQILAASTPMDQASIQGATRTLLQFGVSGEEVLGTIRMLGDVTGGDPFKMQMMALAFGQMAGTGRLMGQELLQMIGAGFNPLQTIAEKTAKTLGTDVNDEMVKLKKEMEEGKISVARVKEAFAIASGRAGSSRG